MEDNSIVITDNNRLAKHNYKLTLEDQKDICANYLFGRANPKVFVDKYNISEQTYYNVINKHKKDNFALLDEHINELRHNFTKKTSMIISKALNRIEEQIDSGEPIDLNKLATITGILYDKEALELGKATSNSAFNINIKIDK